LNEELGACAAPCLGDCTGTTANPTKRNASSFGCLELAAALQPQGKRVGLQADEGLAEAHAAREQPSKGLTLELSGGAAVRLNEKLGACAAPCLSDCTGNTANPTKRNASSFGCLELAAALQGQRPSAEDCKLTKAWPKHTLRESNQARA
jgi:hypothetical protein